MHNCFFYTFAPNFIIYNMKTTTLNLIWEYEEDDKENNIRGGWVLIDATNGNKQVHLSAKLEELLNVELNPDNL